MHSHSHPEIDERKGPDSPDGRHAVASNLKSEISNSKVRPCNNLLRDKLRALRANSLMYSNTELGKKLGYSSAVLSQYLSDDGCKYEGNIAGLEKKAEDFLQALERRRASGVETSPSNVADEMFVAFEYIRKTNDLGAIIAESGEGKSRGIELILKKNDLAILVEATEWNRSIHGIMNSLWTGCAVDGWDRSTQRFPFLVQKMRGSDRPVIIDDAHKLSRDALSLVATFQEKTKCPIALVGCAELVERLSADPQRLSRTGLCWTVKPAQDSNLFRHMIRAIAKDIDGELDELCELCAQVGRGHGHKRTVEKILKRASEIRHAAGQSGSDLGWCEAFRQANKLHIQPAKLN